MISTASPRQRTVSTQILLETSLIVIFHLQMNYSLAEMAVMVRDGDDGRQLCWLKSKAKGGGKLDGQGQTNVLLWRQREASITHECTIGALQ